MFNRSAVRHYPGRLLRRILPFDEPLHRLLSHARCSIPCVVSALVLLAGVSDHGSRCLLAQEEAVSTALPTARETQEPPSDQLQQEETTARLLQLLERRPLHEQAFDGVVTYYVERQRLNQLIESYEQRVASLEDNVASSIILARLYLRVNRPDEAVATVDGIATLPESLGIRQSDYLVFKSQVYQAAQDNAAALEMLSQARDDTLPIADQFRVVEALADYHLQLNQPSEGAEALIEFAQAYPREYLHRKRVADALARRGLHEQAVEQYEETLSLVESQADRRCEILRLMGRSLEELGRGAEAIEAYSEAVGLVAADHWLQTELQQRIVSLYRAEARLDDLVAYCRAQLARAPEQTSTRVLLADVLTSMGQTDEAAEVFEEAVLLMPDDLTLSERRIRFLDRIGEVESAGDEYERILARYPDDTELYIAYGQFLAGNEQVEAAGNQWRYVLQSKLESVSVARRLALLFEAYGLVDDAVECHERCIELAPNRADAYVALSTLQRRQDEPEASIATLERAAIAAGDDPDFLHALSREWVNAGQPDRALEAIEAACRVAPTQIRYLTAQADLLASMGRTDASLDSQRSAIALARTPAQKAQLIKALASRYASLGRLEQLSASEQAALSAPYGPEHLDSLLILARVSDLQRDLQATVGWLEAIRTVEPLHEEACTQLARLHASLGQLDEATQIYTMLMEAYPARMRQYYKAVADMRLRFSDTLGAVEALEDLARRSPDNVGTLQAVAEQLARMNEPELAAGYYTQCLQLQPARHDVRLKLGQALVKIGRLEDALKAFRAAALQNSDRETAADALNKMREVSMQLGVLHVVLDEWQEQVNADPSNTVVAGTLAYALIREYEYTRAGDLLDQILRQNPDDVEILLVRAELQRRMARFDESLDTYRRALRLPNVDRDYVLGEMGKACFEAGRLDQARQYWCQIQHRMYAGTLLKNNALYDDAIEVFREGIRLKPDDLALHRNLIQTLQAAGREDEALEAAEYLLDIVPENIMSIQQLCEAYLKRGDRENAARVAARLFSPSLIEEQSTSAASSSSSRYRGAYGALMSSLYSSYGYGAGYGSGSSQTNLERAISFYQESGLLAELEAVLTQQIELQPDNAVLKLSAVSLFSEAFGKPEYALQLLSDLEDDEFPPEYQQWLGQSSQRDHMRMRRYTLLSMKPALREARLAELEAIEPRELTRLGLLEMAVIRQSMGEEAQAISLLETAATREGADVLVLSGLVDMLVRSEEYERAGPYADQLVKSLEQGKETREQAMRQRVRRDVVRSLPLPLQRQMTEELISALARQYALGSMMASSLTGQISPMGYLQARVNQATILAELGDISGAREIWESLEPPHPADVEGWTTLASIVQEHEQDDLAYGYFERALNASSLMAGDPLLRQLFGESLSAMGYDDSESIDPTFNRIVSLFNTRDRLLDLYDFLRDSGQQVRAKRVAGQYNLNDQLRERYIAERDRARKEFLASDDDPLTASIPYFASVCKLAEILDAGGDWESALTCYQEYLDDFPDELGLLTTMSEIAETEDDIPQAISWERKIIEAQRRLSRHSRQWSQRTLNLVPGIPALLAGSGVSEWDWDDRWSSASSYSYSPYYYGYSRRTGLDPASTWMRLAQLYLVEDNTPAAADALQHAVENAATGNTRSYSNVLEFIQERQLTGDMLSVIRTLAVNAPNNETIQLAFAESLEANDRAEVAVQVYERMLRRGVSDIATLTQIRNRLTAHGADSSAEQQTVADLADELASDPDNIGKKLRYAKALYYSLDLEQALPVLTELIDTAPHLDEARSLLIEIYTIQNDRAQLIAALRDGITRTTDQEARQVIRRRLMNELILDGRIDDAIEEVQQLGVPDQPQSYRQAGILLEYFGHHDKAIEQFAMYDRSSPSSSSRWGAADSGSSMSALIHALEGRPEEAATQILEAVDELIGQQNQYGGVYSYFDSDMDYFEGFTSIFMLYPDIVSHIQSTLEARYEQDPRNATATRLLIMFYSSIGRADLGEELIDRLVEQGLGDQTLITRVISRELARQNFERAIELTESFIEQQPKPKLPPGMPEEYAGQMLLMAPRNYMLCLLGDIYISMDDTDKAFECFAQILNDKVEATREFYATLCLTHNRGDEARAMIDELLAEQDVKSPLLLQLRTMIALADGNAEAGYEYLVQSCPEGMDDSGEYDMYSSGEGGLAQLLSLARLGGLEERALTLIRSRLEANPHDWTLYNLLLQHHLSDGDMESALAILEQAEGVKSLRTQARETRFDMTARFLSADELKEQYEQLLQMKDRQVDDSGGTTMYGGWSSDEGSSVRDELADLEWDAGNRARAVMLWTTRMNPQEAYTHYKVATEYLSRGAYNDAKAEFERAIELDPEHSSSLRALAQMAFDEGDMIATLDYLVTYARCEQQSELEDDGYSWYYSRQYRDLLGQRGDDVNYWAACLKDDPAVAQVIADADPEHAVEIRTTLALLSGDWEELATILPAQLDARPYDPYLWNLWASILERQGDWEQAAQANEMVKRLVKTSIPQHREQLQLILAGAQVREASGGTKGAGPGSGLSSGSGSGGIAGYSSFGSRYGWGDVDDRTTRLASLYMRLGEMEKAERLYLASDSSLEGMITTLAGFLWERGARQRALDLMHLAALLDQDGSNLQRYAGMLARDGQTDQAVDLLVRAYCWESNASDSLGGMIRYASIGASGNEDFEEYDERSTSRSLYQILRMTDSFDTVLADLEAQSRVEPYNRRLSKLILSLRLKGNQWEQAYDALEANAKADPTDAAARLELLHAALQLERWDEALQVIEELDDLLAQDNSTALIGSRAFVSLMQGKPEAAVEALQPLLMEHGEYPDVDVSQILMATYAAARDYDSFRTILEATLNLPIGDNNTSVEDCRSILFNMHLNEGRFDDAADIAFYEYWRQDCVLDGSTQWYRALRSLLLRCRDAGQSLDASRRTAEDAALIRLLLEGTDVGIEAFRKHVASHPNSVDARRGLLLAYLAAGRLDEACTANSDLLEALSPRRPEVWVMPEKVAFAAWSAALSHMMYRSETSATEVLEDGMYGGTVSSMLYYLDVMNEIPVRYEMLYLPYLNSQRILAARCNRKTLLEQTLKKQATLEEFLSTSSWEYDEASSFGIQDADYDQVFGEDWNREFKDDLRERMSYDALITYAETLGPRVSDALWVKLAEAYAVSGNEQAAMRWRTAHSRAMMAYHRTASSPDVTGGEGDSYSWRWSSYLSRRSQDDAARIRSGLRADITRESMEPFKPEQNRSENLPSMESLSGLAMVDDEVRTELLAWADTVGPGWGGTEIFQLLCEYFEATDQPSRILALYDQVYEEAELPRSAQLAVFVRAAVQAKRFERIDRLLDTIVEMSSMHRKEADLLRLMVLRHTGKHDQAAELERRFIASSVPKMYNPAPAPEFLLCEHNYVANVDPNQHLGDDSPYAIRIYDYWSSDQPILGGTTSAQQLARWLDVRLDSRSFIDAAVSLSELREGYEQHGLYEYALPIIALELEQVATVRDRVELMMKRSTLLALTGDTAAARSFAAETESIIRQQMSASLNPLAWTPLLYSLYRSEAFGPDNEAALAVVRDLHANDPTFDQAGLLAFDCLYDLGRYDDAWAEIRHPLDYVCLSSMPNPQIYRLGLAAQQAGDQKASERLLRLALWRAPTHALASQAREVLK
ncbi:MAG: hypothetical protein D8M59_01925 [Planctomycetes bacterium]|nr:hypothetical protein [Planctomycetota bacterium]NOG54522.1 tetratricopeptide repeat protein [Planctomycetota bacterium]